MAKSIQGKKVAILSTDGFEQSELLEPRKALISAGADVKIVSLKAGKIKGWKDKDWGEEVEVDLLASHAKAEDFDAIVLPGGVINPDKLRSDKQAVAFLQGFVDAGKPIGAICHGPQTLIETGALKGRKMTSYKSLKTDLKNAGAEWVDEEVVTDHGLVTSRTPEDLPAFNKKLIEEIAEGVHNRSRAARRPSVEDGSLHA
jgi:protease I